MRPMQLARSTGVLSGDRCFGVIRSGTCHETRCIDRRLIRFLLIMGNLIRLKLSTVSYYISKLSTVSTYECAQTAHLCAPILPPSVFNFVVGDRWDASLRLSISDSVFFFPFFKTFLSFSDKSFLEKTQRKILEMVKKFDEKKLKEKIFTSKFFLHQLGLKILCAEANKKARG